MLFPSFPSFFPDSSTGFPVSHFTAQNPGPYSVYSDTASSCSHVFVLLFKVFGFQRFSCFDCVNILSYFCIFVVHTLLKPNARITPLLLKSSCRSIFSSLPRSGPDQCLFRPGSVRPCCFLLHFSQTPRIGVPCSIFHSTTSKPISGLRRFDFPLSLRSMILFNFFSTQRFSCFDCIHVFFVLLSPVCCSRNCAINSFAYRVAKTIQFNSSSSRLFWS